MQSGNRTRGPKWSYDETLATFGLYMMLNQRQRNDKNNPHIAQLAVGLNRTASSVYMKLMNLRAHDPNEHARGVSGLAHSGKLEIQIWKEYQEQSDKLLILALN
ncbi:restriction endonuclease, partial [Bifidobacterium longum subsp. longum]